MWFMALEGSFLRYLISDYFYDLPRFPVLRASTFPIRVELFTELRPNVIKNKLFPLCFSLKKYALRIIFLCQHHFLPIPLCCSAVAPGVKSRKNSRERIITLDAVARCRGCALQ